MFLDSIADQLLMGARAMSLHSWLQNLRSALEPSRTQRRERRRRRGSPASERQGANFDLLEDRYMMAFLAPVNYAVGSGPVAIATADFTKDGHLDIASANINAATIS